MGFEEGDINLPQTSADSRPESSIRRSAAVFIQSGVTVARNQESRRIIRWEQRIAAIRPDRGAYFLTRRHDRQDFHPDTYSCMLFDSDKTRGRRYGAGYSLPSETRPQHSVIWREPLTCIACLRRSPLTKAAPTRPLSIASIRTPGFLISKCRRHISTPLAHYCDKAHESIR